LDSFPNLFFHGTNPSGWIAECAFVLPNSSKKTNFELVVVGILAAVGIVYMVVSSPHGHSSFQHEMTVTYLRSQTSGFLPVSEHERRCG
jgi:hypothetical protein